jgi:hypothetical protein
MAIDVHGLAPLFYMFDMPPSAAALSLSIEGSDHRERRICLSVSSNSTAAGTYWDKVDVSHILKSPSA